MARRITIMAAAFAATGLLWQGGAARADSDSILTLGVGAGVGFRHINGGSVAATETSFVNHGSVRVKLLWLLGADFSVDLNKDTKLTEPSSDELVFAAKVRATALFYAIPASAFSLYMGGGIGAPKFGDLFDPLSATDSYHVGGGLELHLTDHFTVDLSYYMVLPSIGGVKDHVERLALGAIEDYQDGQSGGAPPPDSIDDLPIPQATVGDFINPNNHEVMIRIFLFL